MPEEKRDRFDPVDSLRKRKKDEKMSSYIIRRVVGMVIVLLLLSLFVFILMQLPQLLG